MEHSDLVSIFKNTDVRSAVREIYRLGESSPPPIAALSSESGRRIYYSVVKAPRLSDRYYSETDREENWSTVQEKWEGRIGGENFPIKDREKYQDLPLGALDLIKSVLRSRWRVSFTDQETALCFVIWRERQRNKGKEEVEMFEGKYPNTHPHTFLEIARSIDVYEVKLIKENLADWQMPAINKFVEQDKEECLALEDRWSHEVGLGSIIEGSRAFRPGQIELSPLQKRVLVILKKISKGKEEFFLPAVIGIARTILEKTEEAGLDVSSKALFDYDLKEAVLSAACHLSQRFPKGDLCYLGDFLEEDEARRVFVRERKEFAERIYLQTRRFLLNRDFLPRTYNPEIRALKKPTREALELRDRLESLLSEDLFTEREEKYASKTLEDKYPWLCLKEEPLAERIVAILEEKGESPRFEEVVAIEAVLREFSKSRDSQYGLYYKGFAISQAVERLYQEMKYSETVSVYRLACCILDGGSPRLRSNLKEKIGNLVEKVEKKLHLLERYCQDKGIDPKSFLEEHLKPKTSPTIDDERKDSLLYPWAGIDDDLLSRVVAILTSRKVQELPKNEEMLLVRRFLSKHY